MSSNLEEAIKQKKFRNAHQRAQLNILFTAGWVFNKHAEVFKAHGITNQQYNVLRILRGAHPNAMNQLEIKSRMIDRMSDMSRLIDRLQKVALIERSTNQHDRRSSYITISKKGLELLAKMDKDEILLDQVTQYISEEEADLLCDLLDKIRG